MCLRNSSDSTIYFLRPTGGGPVKIGCCLRPEARLAQVQRWSPVRLEMVAKMPGNMVLEHRLHAKFMHLHSHGEWFHGDDSIDALIAQINDGVFDPSALPPPQRHYSNAPRRAAA